MALDARANPVGEDAGMAAAPRRRWVTLALVWAAFLISFLDRLTWANVAVSAGESLGLQLAALNIFVTAFYAGYVASNFVSGFATDLFGGRRMLTLALIPLGTFTFLFGFTGSVAVGLALQGLMGLAAGADFSAGIKLIAAWFERAERGRAMGLYFTAPTLGVILTNALVPQALGVVGWSGIYHVFGAVTVVLGILCFVMLRDQPPRRSAPVSGRAVITKAKIAQLVRNRDLVFLTAAGFGSMWGSWGFAFWVNSLMIRGHGLSAATAGAIVSLFGLGAIVGNPLMGYLSDRLGGARKGPIIVCLLAFVSLLIVFGGLGGESQFRVMAPILGIAAFVYMPLLSAMVTEVAGVALAGSATGLSNAIWQIGSILVPVVVGVVFQWTGSFQAAFVALAAGPLFGAGCMMFVQERRR
jgi:sugar phosphate permease